MRKEKERGIPNLLEIIRSLKITLNLFFTRADFLPATAGVPLIGSGLHPSFEGQSRGSETPI
ncbi:hypothetical protein IC007_0364 [Sulfuracidifex tepidarius]|uniref:Uncharacterized protein n=1 Tax=Sulfuracidifex tepidarius TaxID=1294262 RepID=A0A510E044_9CREN|nr:hypothetical protein IC007_0364 [Sulfuracidifex tepidarius]